MAGDEFRYSRSYHAAYLDFSNDLVFIHLRESFYGGLGEDVAKVCSEWRVKACKRIGGSELNDSPTDTDSTLRI